MVGDPSREDAAADARPRRVQPGARAALVDDHGVALDTAVRGVVADVEKAVRCARAISKTGHCCCTHIIVVKFREMADRPPGVGCDTARYVQRSGRYECPQTLKAEILAYETRPRGGATSVDGIYYTGYDT